MSSLGENYEKIRPASDLEKYFYLAGCNNTDLTCYNIKVYSVRKLSREHVLAAMQCLYRKLPNLRVLFLEDENGTLWACYMKEEKLLLQFLNAGEDVSKAHLEQTRTPYNTATGPFWRVTVIPTGEEDGHYYYHILFGFHHSITDGHSSIRICGYFFNFLNSIMNGEVVDVSTQLAHFVDNKEHDKNVEFQRNALESNEDLKLYYKNIAEKLQTIDLSLFKIYPPPLQSCYWVETNWKDFDANSTLSFIRRAKSEGVSVHSAICTLINASIVGLLDDAGEFTEHFDVIVGHDVNERRYFEQDSEAAFGTQIISGKSFVELNKEFFHNFWSKAKEFHKQFYKELETKQGYILLLVLSELILKPEDFYKDSQIPEFHYAVSNMMDITKHLKSTNKLDVVNVVHLRRTTSMHSFLYTASFDVQTFNGKMTLSLDYNTRYVSNLLAEKWMKKIADVFSAVL